MRILWFINTPSNYGHRAGGYNGGGWISSLESELSARTDIELGIAFYLDGQPRRMVADSGVVYYPMATGRGLWDKARDLLCPGGERRERRSWPRVEEELLRVVADFRPDLIQVFGSEGRFGLIADRAGVPVVLHLQGLLTPYWNAYLPPFVSLRQYVCASLSPLGILRRRRGLRGWRCSAMREREILRRTSHFIGRTDWDHRVVATYHPEARYYYGSEVLRPVFYDEAVRTCPERLIVVTTISQPLYKGFDLVLKTARLMRMVMGLDFRWLCFGNIDPRVVERQTGIKHDTVGVELCGVATADELRSAMLTSTVYVHTSYIDNSPNSLCEAQMLGLPVVATYVGGVPSLIDNGRTGYLVPANDPYQLAYLLRRLHGDREANIRMGMEARRVALQRHDREAIVNGLVDIYHQIVRQRDE